MAKDSTAFSMEDLERNPDTVMRLTDCVTCSKHHGADIKYYCKDHDVSCCGVCCSEGHNACFIVIDLQKELPFLLCNNKPDEIIDNLITIEIHLMKFVEFNDVIVKGVGAQINRLTDQIREVRKKINDVLDEMEKQGIRIYKKVVIKKHKENQHCSSLLHAVRNYLHVLEAVRKHGSDVQKFLMTEKVRLQFLSYINLVGEKYEKIGTVSVKADLPSSIQSVLSVSVSELGKVMSTVDNSILPFIGSQSHTKNCQVQIVGVIELQVPSLEKPWYTDVAFLPGDRLLVNDYVNRQCILINSSYEFIASCPLPNIPWNICVLDNQEVAVSFIYGNIIQILSVVGNAIRPVRVIPTRYNCNGIASAGNGNMVVNWYSATLRSEWSLINMRGEVIHSHLYDSPCSQFTNYNRYMALNNAKTRVFISADAIDSLLCFNMDGKMLFTYKSVDLVNPKGVAVDRYDNIYVIGHYSLNIHQLSPNGYLLQVIYSDILSVPYAICIHESRWQRGRRCEQIDKLLSSSGFGNVGVLRK